MKDTEDFMENTMNSGITTPDDFRQKKNKTIDSKKSSPMINAKEARPHTAAVGNRNKQRIKVNVSSSPPT